VTGLRRRLAALGVLVGALLVGGTVAAAPALAHAVVTSTDPADGSRLKEMPASVSITFSEKVGLDLGYLRVVDTRGKRVEDGTATHPDGRNDTATVKLQSGLKDGGYIASYRVVSADSHPITGAFAFTVGDGPLVDASGAVSDSSGADGTVNTLFTITRWASFLGLILLGGLIFVTVCWPAGRSNERARRILWTGWGLSFASTLLGILLQGTYAAGTTITSIFSGDLLSATLASSYGRMLSVRLVALGCLAVLLVRLLRAHSPLPEQVRTRDEDVAAIVGLVVCATFAASGHAVTGIQPTLAVFSEIAHLGAMSAWIGGLVLLTACLLPAHKASELAGVMPRFSRLAFGSVVILAATGTYQAWREVGTIPALWGTEYGKLLSLKILAFAVLIGLGNLGRLAVRRRYLMPVAHALAWTGPGGGSGSVGDPDESPGVGTSGRGLAAAGSEEPAEGGRGRTVALLADVDKERPGDPGVVRRLRASVAIELTITALVLVLTAVLVAQAPARSTYVKPYTATLQMPRGSTVKLTLTPAKVGANSVRLETFAANGKPSDPEQVTLEIELPAEGIGPLPITVGKAGPGVYTSSAVALPRPGTWRFTVRQRVSEFDASVAGTDITVK
jgi:copper transport protein